MQYTIENIVYYNMLDCMAVSYNILQYKIICHSVILIHAV